MFRRFKEDESGAVTVDWVVLTAAVSGLGLATLGVVSGGVEDLSRDVDGEMRGITIITAFAMDATMLATDFANGIGDFLGGTMVDVPGFGEVLQIGPGEMAQTQLTVPEGATSATITFDMLGVDDLSGPPATVMINGQAVAVYSDNHGSIDTQDLGVEGVTVSVNQLYNNSDVGGGSHGSDSRATYTITVENPGDTLTFGVASGSGQPISEEFYAIDDLQVTAS